MTTQELINYYADLLVLQYKGKPKAYAHVQALVKMLIMDQLPTQVRDAYALGTAVGVQLDVIGKYVGVSRAAQNFTGPVTLGDNDYTILIKAGILQNANGSSLADIQRLLQIFFSGTVFVFDHLGMRIGYFLDSNGVNEPLAEVFITQKLLPKPMGVQLSATIYLPSINGFFGFTTNDAPAFNTSGFSTNAGFIGSGWFQNGDFL